ncbi:MAG: hypothetical protein A2W01_09800 [Candidatus Solincola sediminis]|uniref:Uncharacterized protein n=1 Tax=Candidatus Solincola sediminis TaxID=1797199 RepID=A0A1F2WQA8_9ACTN|nr:MAG: hypothetical protein A2Y75_00640 [Candidatus Solincola sediminis]OFW61463.1 MAG: hypothetical protein A2W01_09800 [Candidatus Solincola sediminis]
MEEFGEGAEFAVDADGSVLREVAHFFKENPFLLIDEKRLATLLCRPLQMVSQSVSTLERAGFLGRRDEETLVCIAGDLVYASSGDAS